MEKYMKYGNPFNLKNANCYHHIQEFYPELPDIKYTVLTAKEFLDIALNNGYVLVNKQPIPGDVFITEEPHVHLMYYMGDQQISHHPFKGLSRRELLTGDIMENIKYTVRRKKDGYN